MNIKNNDDSIYHPHLIHDNSKLLASGRNNFGFKYMNGIQKCIYCSNCSHEKSLCSYMCNYQLELFLNLNIKKSNIKNAGLGLFVAKRQIDEKQIICPYYGEILDQGELDFRYDEDELAEYCIQIDEHLYVDSMNIRSPAAYINHDKNPNAFVVSSNFNYKNYIVFPWIVSNRHIHKGEEITIDYGENARFFLS